MNYLKMLAAIGLFVVGVPGLLDDVVQWQDWMNLASWWNVVFMIMGLLLFIHGAFKWNFREQVSRIRAHIIELITIPEWMVEARGKQSFRLYELACLIADVKPSWPLPSDEAMLVYKEILQSLPEEVVDKHQSEGCENVRDIKLNRRQARACVPFDYWTYNSSRQKVYPWFIREKFDQVTPDDRTDEDDRKVIARQMDETGSK